MAKDLFVSLHRCTYCSREGVVAWDVDLVSCREEVCQALASAELRRRRARTVVSAAQRRRRVPIGR